MAYSKIIRCVETAVDRVPHGVSLAKVAIVGIDLSMRGTGVALLLDGYLRRFWGWTEKKGLWKKHSGLLCWYKMPKNTETYRQERMQLVTEWTTGVIRQATALAETVFVAIEGYAFAKNSRGMSDLHEAAGIIKARLWENAIPFRIYDPCSVKLAWTGAGTADKPQMIRAASEMYKVNLDKYEDAAENVADAILIASLLWEELNYKSAAKNLQLASDHIKRVMLRVTKAEPEALITRDLVAPPKGGENPKMELATCPAA